MFFTEKYGFVLGVTMGRVLVLNKCDGLRPSQTSTRPNTNNQTNTETKARRAGRLR